IGGMTAVDVHGATIQDPIFAEIASAFKILGADGQLRTIDATTPPVNGWSPLQFAPVSPGGGGIVAQIIPHVLPRKYANTLQGGMQRYKFFDRQSFIDGFPALLNHTRLEVFYTPYAATVGLANFLALWWDVVDPTSPIPNTAPDPPTACTLAQ